MKMHKLLYLDADDNIVLTHAFDRGNAIERIKRILDIPHSTFEGDTHLTEGWRVQDMYDFLEEATFERLETGKGDDRYMQHDDEMSLEKRYVPTDDRLIPMKNALIKSMREHKLLNAYGSAFRPGRSTTNNYFASKMIPTYIPMWDTDLRTKDDWPVRVELFRQKKSSAPKVVLYVEMDERPTIPSYLDVDVPEQYVFAIELFGYREGLIDAKTIVKLFDAAMNPPEDEYVRYETKDFYEELLDERSHELDDLDSESETRDRERMETSK